MHLIIRTDALDRPHWEAKWRQDGRQVKRRIGMAWLERGRCPAGYLTRDMALVAARDARAAWEASEAVSRARATVEGSEVQSFSDAALRWLQRAERRGRKTSTVTDYRYAVSGYLVPGQSSSRLGIVRAPFAVVALEELTGHEGAAIVGSWFEQMPAGRTREKLEMIVNSVFKYAMAQGWTDDNPMARIDREPVRYDSSDYDFFSTAEVERLIDFAGKQRDGLIYAISAYAGLRCGEVLALKWPGIDFDHRRIHVIGNVSYGKLTTTKGGRGRSVPLVPQLAERLDQRNDRNDDHIFPGNFGATFLDPSTLRRRYASDVKRAGLRHLPMHSLRHHFGSVAVNSASLVQVRDWLGHADLRTTSRYLHAKSHVSDADLLGGAFG
jgi:integrase